MSGHTRFLSIALVAALTPAAVAAGTIKVIYTEISGSPTAVVPGALDATGSPAFAEWTAIEDVSLEHDGSHWVIKGRETLGSTLDTILVLGSGTSGTMFCQDGQPLKGGVAGEEYDFFDSVTPVSWDEFGNMAFSCRAKNGVSSVKEKVIYFDGVTHTVKFTESFPASGLIDVPANPTGDELLGNSIASVQLMNNGKIWFANTPIQNCHSSRYPAIFIDAVGFRQSGVSPIGSEIWDNFGYADTGTTPDGLHWFAEGDTENPNTAIDKILVVDDVIMFQESFPIAGSSVIFTDVFDTRMLSDGTWFSRGDDPNNDDWAVRNNVLIAKTGDPISAGSSELWGDSFTTFSGNRVGDWVLTGNTTEPNTAKDTVMVVNGNVVLREDDPIDVDGNGLFDDNAYIASFAANDIRMTDDKVLYFIITLRDGVGTSLGDAFLRMELCGNVTSYGTGCAGSNGLTPSLDLTGCPFPGELVIYDVKNGLANSTAFGFLGLSQISVPTYGSCTVLVNPLPGILVLPLNGAGAIAIGGALPPIASGFNFTSQVFVADPGISYGFSNSNGIDVHIN